MVLSLFYLPGRDMFGAGLGYPPLLRRAEGLLGRAPVLERGDSVKCVAARE